VPLSRATKTKCHARGLSLPQFNLGGCRFAPHAWPGGAEFRACGVGGGCGPPALWSWHALDILLVTAARQGGGAKKRGNALLSLAWSSDGVSVACGAVCGVRFCVVRACVTPEGGGLDVRDAVSFRFVSFRFVCRVSERIRLCVSVHTCMTCILYTSACVYAFNPRVCICIVCSCVWMCTFTLRCVRACVCTCCPRVCTYHILCVHIYLIWMHT